MNGTLLQKLPDPFVMENGKTVSTMEEWRKRREEIKKSVLDIGYGGMPPEPDSTGGTLLCSGSCGLRTYHVTVKSGGRELGFEMRLFVPAMEDNKKYPVVLEGDGCWTYLTEKAIENFRSRGIITAQFNRCALVRDVPDNAEVLDSPLYRLFPGIASGSVAGWAWGFSRCIDVLEKLPFVDSGSIAITGHSRGGKAVLLAGAADERPFIVNPNCSGAGGCGCWRYRIGDAKTKSKERDEVMADLFANKKRSEELSDLAIISPNWLGRKMSGYQDCEADIPFDQHYLKALIAPRYLLQTDALEDIGANPPGSHGTFLAAREVYRFLGAGERILANYRNGGHAHAFEDYITLADLIYCLRNNKPPPAFLQCDPFPQMREIFDWQSP